MRKFLICLLAVFATVGTAAAQDSLTVWTTFGSESLEWLQSEIAAFSAAFGVEVDVVTVVLNDIPQQMLLGAPQGEAADVIVGVPHDQIGAMADGGVLADLSSYATPAYLEDLSEQARLAFTFAGKLFGLPMFVEGPALIVNTDLVPNRPATYEEMIALAQELTTDDTFGFMCDCLGNFYFAYNWLHTPGGFVFARDASGTLDPATIGLDNEGAIAGAEMLKALQHEYDLIPPGTDYNVANGLFVDGALAMIYNGPWAISQYRSAGIDVEVMPLPPMADGTPWSGFMGVQGILVNQFSSNLTDAANLAKWLTRSDAQVSLAQLTGRIPASNTAVAEVADDPVISGFGAALQNAEPMPNIPEMGTVWGPMGGALSVIFEDANSDVAEILRRAVSEITGN